MHLVKTLEDKLKKGFRQIKVLAFGKNDVRTPFAAMPFGFDSVPVEGVRAVYSETANKKEPVLVGFIFKNRIAEKGETRLFATNDQGEEQGFVYLKKDGELHLLSDVDNAVRYSELETAFNQLQSDFDDLVSKYNTHIHTTTAVDGLGNTGVIAPTTSTGNPSTADITPSKINEIKVP